MNNKIKTAMTLVEDAKSGKTSPQKVLQQLETMAQSEDAGSETFAFLQDGHSLVKSYSVRAVEARTHSLLEQNLERLREIAESSGEQV
jgi:hypothetical protein